MADLHHTVEDDIAFYRAQVDRFEQQMDSLSAADLAAQAQAQAHPSPFRRIYRGMIALTKKLRLYDLITRSRLFKSVAETGLFAALGRRK